MLPNIISFAKRIAKTNTESVNPAKPINFASCSSWLFRGVGSLVASADLRATFPYSVESPTAETS